MVLDRNKTFLFFLLWFDFSTECPKLDLADLKANMKVLINILTIDHMFDEGLSLVCS